MAYFTKIGIGGHFVQQFVFSMLVVPAVIIMENQYWSFDGVQSFIMLFVVLFGVLILTLSLRIGLMFGRNDKIWGHSDTPSSPQNAYLLNSVDAVTPKRKGCGSLYLCDGFRMLFVDNKMTRYGTINVILVFLLTDLVSSYEPLTIAGVDTNVDDETLGNFCGNYLTNLVYQQCWGSLFTAVGAVLYIYVLLPFVDTFHFYRFVYPVSSIFVGGAVFVISGVFTDGIDQTWLSLSLGFLWAFFMYAQQFDDFLNLGFMNKEAVGFYQIVYSWSNNVWQIFGYLFVYLDVMNVAVAVMIGILLISSVIQSLCFSKLFAPKRAGLAGE